MALKKINRVVRVNKNENVKKTIFIGLDFGTTFSKVSYVISGRYGLSKVYTLKNWNTTEEQSYFKKSVLYKDTSENLYFNEHKNAELVKYFKYNMINNVLRSDDSSFVDNRHEAQLYSVFFLANLIKLVKERIMNDTKHNMQPTDDVEWYINMGVPIDNYEEDKDKKFVYDKILNIAYVLSDNVKEQMSLEELDKFFTNVVPTPNNNLNTIPELYAECLFFQLDKNIPNSFYGIIDIGGGTIDIATFHKSVTDEEEVIAENISKDILDLGVETLISRIVNNPMEKLDREEARAFLIDSDNVMFENDNFVRQFDPSIINKHMILFNRNCLRRSYGYCFTIKLREAMRSSGMLNEPISYFITGGGKDIGIYNRIFSTMKADFNSGLQHKQEFYHVKLEDSRFYDENYVEHNERIITSQMLAQDIYNIPRIQNWDWNFSNEIKTTSIDMESIMDRRQDQYRD